MREPLPVTTVTPTSSTPAPTSSVTPTATKPATSPTPSTPTPTPTPPSTVKPVIDEADLAANYGWALTVLKSHPELYRLFQLAVAETWTPERFAAEVRNSTWYKQTQAASRQWTMLEQTDPATAAAQLSSRKLTVQLLTQQLGMTLSDAALSKMAHDSLLFGWTDDQLKSQIASSWTFTPGQVQKGLAATSLDTIRQATQDYLVPISDSAIQQWTQQIMSGYSTPQDYIEYAKSQAKSLFPQLTNAIDKGITVDAFADPYRQIASQMLGVNPNSISFLDPKWRVALDRVDPATKERSIMSLADWQTLLRKDPQYGWDKTPGAVQEGAGLTTKLAQMFGALG